jgi:hypothetical protein
MDHPKKLLSIACLAALATACSSAGPEEDVGVTDVGQGALTELSDCTVSSAGAAGGSAVAVALLITAECAGLAAVTGPGELVCLVPLAGAGIASLFALLETERAIVSCNRSTSGGGTPRTRRIPIARPVEVAGGDPNTGCNRYNFRPNDGKHPPMSPEGPPANWRTRYVGYGPPRGQSPRLEDCAISNPRQLVCVMTIAGQRLPFTCRRDTPGGSSRADDEECNFHCYLDNR